jgi:hypothetical protein
MGHEVFLACRYPGLGALRHPATAHRHSVARAWRAWVHGAILAFMVVCKWRCAHTLRAYAGVEWMYTLTNRLASLTNLSVSCTAGRQSVCHTTLKMSIRTNSVISQRCASSQIKPVCFTFTRHNRNYQYSIIPTEMGSIHRDTYVMLLILIDAITKEQKRLTILFHRLSRRPTWIVLDPNNSSSSISTYKSCSTNNSQLAS